MNIRGVILSLVLAAALRGQSRPPLVVGVENEDGSAPIVNPGSLGHVLGANFGAVENTVVTVNGLKAKVLAVSGNQIRVLFPSALPEGDASLTVSVDGEVSDAIRVLVSHGVAAPRFSGHGAVLGSPGAAHPPIRTLVTSLDAAASTATTGSGIVYTCDPTINALSATACAVLNTTIAALYSNAFSNISANIYVTTGTGSIGSSNWSYNRYTYADFRSALIAGASGAHDATAIADSVPAANPYGSDEIGVPYALQRALGLSPPSCLPANGCYDGTIMVNSSTSFYFRSGSITGNQYDFFSVVEHETDEILGTASCAFGCGAASTLLPADLFRYHSNGTRSFAAGTNDSCASSDATNACFSLDGVHMLQPYNNVNGGGDFGDWVANCAAPLVQDVAICAGTAGVDISPSAEILVLDAVGYTLRSPSAGLQFIPVTPCRVADTRNPAGPFGGPSMAAASTRNFAIPAGSCGIPSTAQAYSLNITVVPQGPLGFLAIWPAGQTQPLVSTLNSDGRVKANAAIVPAGSGGAVSVYASNPTDVVVDISGYFVTPGSGTLAFYPLMPCRIADTRNAVGALGGPGMSSNVARSFPILSSPCGIPSTAQAYALNMTVVPAGALGYLATWPSGSSQPLVSTLNAPTGAVLANAAIVPAGTGGSIEVLATNPTDLVIDINGYFAPPGAPGALALYPAIPCRVADTRNPTGAFGGPALAGSVSRSFAVTSSGCGIPAGAQAYSVNATIVPPGIVWFLTLYGGGSLPDNSTLNDSDGTVVANAAVVPAAGDGSVAAYTSNATQLILDINGFFAP